MTRIAVVEPDGTGGMIHYAYQMADALTDAGCEVTLHTSRHYELAALPHRFTARAEMNLWPAIEASTWPGLVGRIGRKARRVWRGLRYAMAWQRLTSRLVEDRPDAVLFDTIRFPFQVVFLRRLRRHGITLGQICHEFEPRERGPLSRALVRHLSTGVYRTFAAIFLHGEQNRKAFLAAFPIDPEVTHVIPHGNETMLLHTADRGGDLSERYGIAPGEPVTLFFGGLRPSKGIEDLIDAFAAIADTTPGTLLIVGHPAGVDPVDLRRRAEGWDVGDRVTIDARYVDLAEIGPLMRAVTCVALPYRSATASGVLQAAYTFGRPVVATTIGALAEDVDHGRTGLLVAPGDTPALSAALHTLLTDPERAARMGVAAQQAAAEQFSWRPIAATILATVEGVRA